MKPRQDSQDRTARTSIDLAAQLMGVPGVARSRAVAVHWSATGTNSVAAAGMAGEGAAPVFRG
jgi:hypothetical protein